MTSFLQVNGIQVAYEDTGGEGTPLLLLHGLTAHMANFGGLLRHGLAENLRVIRMDLRGRGLTDKPETAYRMSDHAADVLRLMDVLGLESVIMGGHSFGALLTMYLAASFPQRVQKLVLIDAGIEATHTDVLEKIRPSLERLGKIVPSIDAYLTAVKASPYYADGFWDEDLEAYYRADVETLPDGSVRSHAAKHAIEQAIEGVLSEDWLNIVARVHQPALLIHASGNIGALPPVLSTQGALDTVKLLGNCEYQPVGGHHMTMVFGDHAAQVVRAIRAFITRDTALKD